nr:hypothetical protein [Tanacetum cinerariifolium]
MTGNISYLSSYEPFDGGYVSFGQGGCKITEKRTVKTGKLEFENVYFVKDLKDFKLLDDANILLRTPRQHNMYSIDLNNIVPDMCERKPRKGQNRIKTRQNGKRGEAGKSLKQLKWIKEEKLSKKQKEWPKMQIPVKSYSSYKKRK